MRAFVTGGTGFVGSNLVAALLERGMQVRVLRRSTSPMAALEGLDCETRIGDVNDGVDALAEAMADCDWVFHTAAISDYWRYRTQTRLYRTNVDGTRDMAAAAQRAGVKRFVYTSSLAALGVPERGHELIETDEFNIRPRQFPYGHSKHLAEAELRKAAAGGLPVVIVNPTRVYGPGHLTEGNTLSLLIDEYDRGRAPALLNGGRNVGNYVHVDDVVEGHLLAMKSGRPGEKYLLGGDNASLREFFTQIDEISGKKHFTFTIRKPGAMIFALIQQKRAEWFGKYPLIPPPWVRVFLSEWAFSSAKAQRALGYRARSLGEGLFETYEWLMRLRQLEAR